MSIRNQILCSLGIMFLVSCVMCSVSWVITLHQQGEGDVINLAARQRMHVHRMAKETVTAVLKARDGATVPSALAAAIVQRLEDMVRIQKLLVSGGTYQNGQRIDIEKPKAQTAAPFEDALRKLSLFEAEVKKVLANPKTPIDDLEKLAEELVSAQDQGVELLAKQSAAEDTLMLTVQGAGIALSAALFLLVLALLRRTLQQPLDRLQVYAEAVAGGNYKAAAEGRYPKELGVLRDSLARMVAAMEVKMAEVRTKSSEAERHAAEADSALARAREQEKRTGEVLARMNEAASKARAVSASVMDESAHLLEQAEHVARGAEHQRDRMVETATAMEEMNATVLEVARNAGSAAESAASAREKALTGAQGVRSAVESIETIRRRILDLKESMTRLGQQADNIGHIMNVISDIADQTNLLALNAAIEAARAGEAGRGFAVVADEVRKLAEKTMAATKEVGDAVVSIQGQARENIAAVDGAASGIEESTQAAAASGRYMDEIVVIVESTASQVDSIATASEEQSATSEEINRAVEEVNDIARETADGMATATAALSALTELAHELDDVIRQMTGDSASKAVRAVTAGHAATPAKRPALPPSRPAPSKPKALAAHPAAKKALPAAHAGKSRPAAPAKAAESVGGNSIGGGILQWDQSLAVGVHEIDGQHQKLVQMICDLHEAMRTGKGKGQVEQILTELENYSVEHFGYEEKLMEQHKYPGYLNHRKEHEAFVDKVIAFGNDFRANRAALTTEVMNFLKNWLVGHIKGTDKKYSSFFNERGVR